MGVQRIAFIVFGILSIAFSIWHALNVLRDVHAFNTLVFADWFFDMILLVLGIFAIRRGIKQYG